MKLTCGAEKGAGADSAACDQFYAIFLRRQPLSSFHLSSSNKAYKDDEKPPLSHYLIVFISPLSTITIPLLSRSTSRKESVNSVGLPHELSVLMQAAARPLTSSRTLNDSFTAIGVHELAGLVF